MAVSHTILRLVAVSLRFVLADVRLQLPLLVATLFPEKLRELLPERLFALVTSERFVCGLKALLALNFVRICSSTLSRWHINNFRKAAKFVPRQEVVLITGGSSGIGELVALELAEKGAKVISFDVNPPKKAQPGVHFYQVDITSPESIAEAAAKLRKEHGDPTVLVNNAGVGHAMTIMDEPVAKIRQSFDVNVVSHFFTVKEFMPAMIKRNHGHIVTVASMAAYVTVASIVDYNCTKAGAVAFHEGVASELKHRYDAPGVRTSLVTPMWVRTPMIGALVNDPTFSDPVLEPEDVSTAIVKQIQSGSSGHLVLPNHYSIITGVRAWPGWMQNGIRNFVGSLMDVRVRFGGVYKRDPRLDGGTLPGMGA